MDRKVYEKNPLTLEDMFKILDNSELLNHYLALFENSDKESVIYTLKAFIKKNFELNTLGARLINTLINQYFIKGGKLENTTVKELTFQKKLKL